MKLDESIELKHKIHEMKRVTKSRARALMHNMATDNSISGCLYEVLTLEGFLPKNLKEGESYDESFTEMMEDEDIMYEMYSSCQTNESSCGSKVREWMDTKGSKKNMDEVMRDLKEYDKPAMSSFKKRYGKKKGEEVYYATANKQDRSPETFKKKVSEVEDKSVAFKKQRSELDDRISTFEQSVKDFVSEFMRVNFNSDDLARHFRMKTFDPDFFVEYLKKQSEESFDEYYERLTKRDVSNPYNLIFLDFLFPAKRTFMDTYISNTKIYDRFSNVVNSLFNDYNNSYRAMRNMSLRGVDSKKPDPSQYRFGKIQEYNIPVKGRSVDAENKKNSKSSTTNALDSSKKTQKTIQSKVEDLRNKRKTKFEEEIENVEKGFRNNLDLDYNNGITKDKADDIKDEAKGKAPKDHANVDQDSKGGEILLGAAEARGDSEEFKDDYTSSEARAQVKAQNPREKNTVFNPKNEKLKEALNRLRDLM